MFSYGDLARTAERVAAGLCALHGADDLREARVAFLVPSSFAHVAVSRGIWLAGGVAVPLAVSHPPAELEYVVRDSGASIVIASGRQAEALEAMAPAAGAPFLRTPNLRPGATETRDSPQFQIRAKTGKGDSPHFQIGAKTEKGDSPLFGIGGKTGKGDSPLFLARRALIVYTSGTTGKPKGVVTTHAQLRAQIASLVAAWEWTRDDCALLVLPLHHVHAIVNVLGSALAAGASCEMLPQFEPEPTGQRLASGYVTVFSAVPTIHHRRSPRGRRAAGHAARVSSGSRRARLMMSDRPRSRSAR